MTEMTTLSPSLRLLIPTTPRRDLSRDFSILTGQSRSIPSLRKVAFPGNLPDFQSLGKFCGFGGNAGFGGFNAWSQEGSLQEVEDVSPASVELKPICSESQFDRVIAEAQQLEESIIVVWMANWCRKCIYLKPKLERLAADYHPRLRFYCVDVNNVPHKLVERAGVTKMPTIQLWKDSKKQEEVIGGHKAYLVVNEVRDMIEKESTSDL